MAIVCPLLVSGDRLFVDISVRHFQTDGIYSFVYGKTFHVKRLQMQGDKLAVLSITLPMRNGTSMKNRRISFM